MRRPVHGFRVNESGSVAERLVEHPANVPWVLLAIFVQGNYPLRDRARHPRERGWMLAVVTREPDGTNEGVIGGEPPHDVGGTVHCAIVYE